jgi:hypothetical protein
MAALPPKSFLSSCCREPVVFCATHQPAKSHLVLSLYHFECGYCRRRLDVPNRVLEMISAYANGKRGE